MSKMIPRWLDALVHRRARLQCNLCGARRNRFRPLPAFYRESAKKHGWIHDFESLESLNLADYTCPECGAADRDRLTALYLSELLGSRGAPETFALLDIAPSRPLERWIKGYPHVKYRSADLYMKDVDDRVDVTDLHCYGDATFDGFLCSHVLEHVGDDARAMAELFRVLKPGGTGLLLVPLVIGLDRTIEDAAATSPEARWRLFGQDDHVRAYARSDFVRRLQATGFRVTPVGIEHFGSAVFAAHAITPTSKLYVAVREA